MNCQKEEWNGMCCCNCRYMQQVNKHPWNKGDGKGSISEKMGNVCTAGPVTEDQSMKYIFFDADHGMCEMHEFKK